MTRKVCQNKFWTYTNSSLPELGSLLLNYGVVASAIYDYENVYEWLECKLPCEAVELNVSRQHRDGEITETEPLAFLLVGNDVAAMSEMVQEIASRVESALRLPMTIGIIEHLGEDDYRYVPSSELMASSQRIAEKYKDAFAEMKRLGD